MEHLGEEWQYLLQAYLSGVFGVDKEFHHLVHECFTNMLSQGAGFDVYHIKKGSGYISSQCYFVISQKILTLRLIAL